ncbi:MAG: aminotransferase class V-fold PLP-dependent enzyme, partial [Synechococcaceae cyanobacterium RL_1_2]|nr:aminotransferase class V-fold PLP-dependent enzyme [Synechococcaceae cyanobacterium RL_1_2]
MDLQEHRQQFPGLNNKFYFNYGGQGPMPKASLEAIIDSYKHLEVHGPFSYKSNNWVSQCLMTTKQTIAQEIGIHPHHLTLTENVTAGCNVALWGMDWQPGDHLLLTDCEHPGVIAIALELQRRCGITFSTCPVGNTLNGGDPVAVIREHLRPETKMVIVSHLLWNTGQILPIKEIAAACHDRDTLLLVDAAQSVGSLPLDLLASGVDYYAFTGHKWWCGPGGVGGLFISPQVKTNPTFIGWRGVDETVKDDAFEIIWKQDGAKYEIATSAYPLYYGLKAAIDTHNEWGDAHQRYEQIKLNSAYLWGELTKIPGLSCLKDSAPEAGLISFTVDSLQSHTSLAKALERSGLMVRTLALPNCLRACV